MKPSSVARHHSGGVHFSSAEGAEMTKGICVRTFGLFEQDAQRTGLWKLMEQAFLGYQVLRLQNNWGWTPAFCLVEWLLQPQGNKKKKRRDETHNEQRERQEVVFPCIKDSTDYETALGCLLWLKRMSSRRYFPVSYVQIKSERRRCAASNKLFIHVDVCFLPASWEKQWQKKVLMMRTVPSGSV